MGVQPFTLCELIYCCQVCLVVIVLCGHVACMVHACVRTVCRGGNATHVCFVQMHAQRIFFMLVCKLLLSVFAWLQSSLCPYGLHAPCLCVTVYRIGDALAQCTLLYVHAPRFAYLDCVGHVETHAGHCADAAWCL